MAEERRGLAASQLHSAFLHLPQGVRAAGDNDKAGRHTVSTAMAKSWPSWRGQPSGTEKRGKQMSRCREGMRKQVGWDT
eukprot:561678-Alexandrium_andersonii.AAC.1